MNLTSISVAPETWVLIRSRFLDAGGIPRKTGVVPIVEGRYVVPIEPDVLATIRSRALPGEDDDRTFCRLLWRMRP